VRVHFWAAPNVVPGGHKVQMEGTAAALERLGVEVSMSSSEQVLPPGVEVVHAFGVPAERLREARQARALVACSTIYWSRSYRRGMAGPKSSFAARVASLRWSASLSASAARGRLFDKAATLMEPEAGYIRDLEAADLLLPNSPGEASALREDLKVTAPLWLVPNGVDASRFSGVTSSDDRPIDVVCVGRFEPHKNQLGLIRALRNTSLRVVIVGHLHPHHPNYRLECLRAARGSGIEVREAVPDDQLPELYASAKLHVLPSWFETTGLVSLEAAASGCRVVSTSRGHAKYYFGDLAWYCDPASPASMVEAIEAALAERPGGELKGHVLRHFTWDEAARATKYAYEHLIEGSYAFAEMEWPFPPSR
jgi:glycosyltransferase involved in cell wall biosynthesis